jgi:hypothetical protein
MGIAGVVIGRTNFGLRPVLTRKAKVEQYIDVEF